MGISPEVVKTPFCASSRLLVTAIAKKRAQDSLEGPRSRLITMESITNDIYWLHVL